MNEIVIPCIEMAAGLLIAAAGFLLRRKKVKELAALSEAPTKKQKRGKLFGMVLMVVGLWLFVTTLVPFVFGPTSSSGFQVELFPKRYDVLGFSLSSTVVVTWIAMGILLLLALLVRLIVIPRMQDTPKGLQNILELAVDGINSYTQSKAGKLGENLSAYLFSLATLMIACAVVELFGVRPPTADITMTLGMSLITFILINYYGIREKGVGGRLKSLAQPTPVVFPIKIISDCAIPISLACRLFGNMLGGMIVVDLLYSALGTSAVGLPSVIGLYFNVFHPLIQAFIFVTLTLTFINEAAE